MDAPSLSDEEIHYLVAAFFRHHYPKESAGDREEEAVEDSERAFEDKHTEVVSLWQADNDFNAYERVRDLMWQGNDDAWRVLLALVEQAPDNRALDLVGASPLEDFLNERTAVTYAERIAAEATRNPRFARALRASWKLPDSLSQLIGRTP